MAVMASGSPRVHPKMVAMSLTKLVRTPMKIKATVKATQPPPKSVGGTKANNTCEERNTTHNISMHGEAWHQCCE